MSRRIRITRFGYLVIGSGLGGLVVILALIIGLVSCNKKEKSPTPPDDSSPGITLDDQEQDTEGDDASTSLSDTTYAPNVDSDVVVPPVVPDVPITTPEPQATPTPAPDVMRTPSPLEVENAQNAKLNNSGVVLRNAPNKSGSILGKYSANTRLVIYAESGDYYLVQVVKDNIFGYMAKKFIAIVNVTPTPTPSPTPEPIPEGALAGSVAKTKVALRSAPDLSNDANKIGELAQGARVFVYFTYTNPNGEPFYYVQVADPTSSHYGKFAYCYKTYLKVNGAVPTGTPQP